MKYTLTQDEVIEALAHYIGRRDRLIKEGENYKITVTYQITTDAEGRLLDILGASVEFGPPESAPAEAKG